MRMFDMYYFRNEMKEKILQSNTHINFQKQRDPIIHDFY
jgi:hypothetical protein